MLLQNTDFEKRKHKNKYMKKTDLFSLKYVTFFSITILIMSCNTFKKQSSSVANDSQITLITLAPEHFHAALVQKKMYPQVNRDVYVYGASNEAVKNHLQLINSYNNNKNNPTHWNEVVYTGSDFLTKMLKEKKGNVVVLAGNNKEKTKYIESSINAGLNVLSDKPMAINEKGFELLTKAFKAAEKNKKILYDIMTERYEITSMIQKELSMDANIFGQLQKGTADNPAIIKESVHHFYKEVSGTPLVRPQWYYDVEQEGEGLVDVTTHLVDLIQWTCFPEQIIDYKKDIQMIKSERWATDISFTQFQNSTLAKQWPAYLNKYIHNNTLKVFANGEMNYTIKGVHAKVGVIWNYQAAKGSGDTHFSQLKGSKSTLMIQQGKEQNYKPELFLVPDKKENKKIIESYLTAKMYSLQKSFPGISIENTTEGWHIKIPQTLRSSHEEHFSKVAQKFFDYVQKRTMPDWEVPNMIAKYYTTTLAAKTAITVEK